MLLECHWLTSQGLVWLEEEVIFRRELNEAGIQNARGET
jgi:hypothetical protein